MAMTTISEMLERILEMDLLTRESEEISDGFTRLEMVENMYTPKAMRIKQQNIHTRIMGKNDKIMQETMMEILFKTNQQGDIIEQQTSVDAGSSFEKIKYDPLKYNVVYDNKKNLLFSTVKGTKSDPHGIQVDCINRTAYVYDEDERIRMILCDCVPADGTRFVIDNMEFLQIYYIEYNDEGMPSAINLTNVDKHNNSYGFRRFIIHYRENGFIEYIRTDGRGKYDNEWFTYNDDGTVDVIKCKVDKNKVVTEKVALKFKLRK